jgi:hypothetical protein
LILIKKLRGMILVIPLNSKLDFQKEEIYMAAPSLTVVDSTDKTVTIWDAGVVMANNDSNVLSITLWNNRGGSTNLSDLKEANITTLDPDGGALTDVVANKWVRVNTPALDGSTSVWTPVGGNVVKMLRADGCTAADGYVIKGTANDGTLANAKPNYVTINLKHHVPAGATTGIRDFKTRINGYYT